MQAAISARYEAWAPLTEADFATKTPRRVKWEEVEASAAAEAVAMKPVQYRAVPHGRGAQRVAVHDIMKLEIGTKQQHNVPLAQVEYTGTHACLLPGVAGSVCFWSTARQLEHAVLYADSITAGCKALVWG